MGLVEKPCDKCGRLVKVRFPLGDGRWVCKICKQWTKGNDEE